MRPTRRGLIGAGVGLIATPALAEVATDAAPPASDARASTGALGSSQRAVRSAASGFGAPLSRPSRVQWASWFSTPSA